MFRRTPEKPQAQIADAPAGLQAGLLAADADLLAAALDLDLVDAEDLARRAAPEERTR